MTRRTERVGGFLIVEDTRLPWQAYQLDKARKIVVCGELGAVKDRLFMLAWEAVVRRDLRLQLQEFAARVGVEYSSTRTTKTP